MPSRSYAVMPSFMHTISIARDWQQSDYYSKVDNEAGLAPFWGNDSPFLPLFSKLDTRNIVELACGHGRHAAEILRRKPVNRLYAVDVNQTNVDFCRRRFSDDSRVICFQNTGRDLSALDDSSISAVLSYDAMVHFEMWNVDEYLRDIFRVLEVGGRALLHHSNNDRQPGNTYQSNYSWRNFMSAPLFKHLAVRAGLFVEEQVLIDWDGVPHIDCLSLLRKDPDASRMQETTVKFIKLRRFKHRIAKVAERALGTILYNQR